VGALWKSRVIATASGAALATKVSVNFEKEKKLKGYN
jgi:hypothetical protein